MWKRFYKVGSSKEGGTLLQLRNIIDRRNIGSGKKIKHHVNEIEDFLELVINCHLIVAALHFFGMADIEDTPHTNAFPSNIATLPHNSCKKFFKAKMIKIIETYVVPRGLAVASGTSAIVEPTPQDNPHVLRIQAEHDYACPPSPVSDCRAGGRSLPQTMRQHVPRSQASQLVKKVSPDGVYNYASALLNDGLQLLEFKDAIREGDGTRILRIWKVLLLYFHHAGHKNYKLESFHLSSMVNAIASPRIAAQLTWSRTVNVRGGKGHNMPVDLHMEHLNRTSKDYVANLGANTGETPIVQCGKSLSGIMAVCQHYDQENSVSPQSVQHTKHSTAQDMKKILTQLTSASSVFDYIPGREHKSFKGMKTSISDCIDVEKLLDWLKKQKEQVKSEITVARAYGHKL